MGTTGRDVELAMLAEARNEVGAADHKASMVLAVLGIGFGAVLGGLVAREWQPSEMNSFAHVVWWFGAVAALASVLFAGSAVWPRFTLPTQTADVFYWGHVATFTTQASLEQALDRRPPELEDRTRHQLFALSLIVARKYWCVRRAMQLSVLSAALLIIAGIASY